MKPPNTSPSVGLPFRRRRSIATKPHRADAAKKGGPSLDRLLWCDVCLLSLWWRGIGAGRSNLQVALYFHAARVLFCDALSRVFRVLVGDGSGKLNRLAVHGNVHIGG